jgi:hypothetical protein
MTRTSPRRSSRTLWSAVYLSSALALATTAAAQDVHRPFAPPPPSADQLDQEAARLRDSIPEYARAVRLLEQSVALRRADDPRASESLWWAAWFSYDRGDLPGARAFLEQSADRALMRGNTVAAANDEIDAGLMAQEEGNAAEVERLGQKAVQLAHAPELSATERASILSRIGYDGRTRRYVDASPR